MSWNVDETRALFPALSRQVNGKNLVYFDNAATSQKPVGVLEMQQRMSTLSNANIHRAVHAMSVEATDLYEAGRRAVGAFINADEKVGCTIFTAGATAAFNLLAYSFSARYLSPGDTILLSEAEHHSNLVPWQMAALRHGAKVEYIPVLESGELDMEAYARLLENGVKIVSVAHISNVLGVVNPVAEIVAMAHAKGVPVVLDGAQAIVHEKVDVSALDCDFYVFSGHKVYAPTGTGVLYGKRALLDEMPPWMGGGDMVDTVSYEKTTYAPLPLKFEAGTPNFAAAACYAPALEFAGAILSSEAAAAHMRTMTEYLLRELTATEGLKLYGNPADTGLKTPLFSFTIEGAHPSDMAQILDKMGVAVRSGLMCAEPLVTKYSESGMLRVSLLPYNTMEEAEYFVAALRRTLKMLL